MLCASLTHTSLKMDEVECDYRGFHGLRTKWENRLEKGQSRFVSIKHRTDTSCLKKEVLKNLARGKAIMEWKGIDIRKDPLDLAITSMLLWKLKPATIIEIGTYTGASALWLADHLRLFNIKGHVYTVDNNHTLIGDGMRKVDGITFVKGDCNAMEKSLSPAMLQELAHPWLLFEDAHVNVGGVLRYFYPHLQTGDYMVVEDTHPDYPADMADELEQQPNFDTWGLDKMNTVRTFVEEQGDNFMVDTFYTDMFGYNATWNMNAYLRRM